MIKGYYSKNTGNFYIDDKPEERHPVRSFLKTFVKGAIATGVIILILIILF